MLTVLLAEAELELIPESILSHPRIISSAERSKKKPQELILDSSMHHSAMGNLPEQERRGRPDITHLFFLITLESILNKRGQLKVVVHTRNDEMITIDPATRMIKNYDRFLGLAEQLFHQHVVPDETKPLLRLTPQMTLQNVIKDIQADTVIAFESLGRAVGLPQLFTEQKQKAHKNILCIIGGFPKGEFHIDMKTITDEVISIYPEMLPAWTVAGEIIVNYENVFL